jgi:hypothetical protein
MSQEQRAPFAVPLPKKGANADALFSLLPSLAVGSPYVDPHKLGKRARSHVKDDRPLFKPAGFVHFNETFPTLAVSETVSPAMDTEATAKKEAVVVRGVYVFRPNEAFAKFPEYMEDPVEEKIKLRRQTIKQIHEKLKDHPPFRVSAPALAPFTKASELYYSLVPRGGIPKERRVKKGGDAASVSAFRPAGYCPALSKFPEHMSDPIPYHEAKKKDKDASVESCWRPTDAMLKSKPMPSVAFNVVNLRKEPVFHLRH